tara:strand:+ start:337 stop:489 length:153 start_codon:yes stop_codon:yes gene_type:complete
MKAQKQIIIEECDWVHSKYRASEWEKKVDIKRWEHDCILKRYVIDYDEIK